MDPAKPADFPFRLAVNSSTLKSFGLDILTQMRLSREAGYEGIELWMRDLTAFVEAGGNPADIRRAAEDLGIEVFDCIGFLRWADRDPAVRQAEVETARREMQMVREIGCPAMAAPPFGDTEGVSTEDYAERFRELHRIGSGIGVEPILEIWGHRGGIRTVRASRDILAASGIAEGKVLVDPIHIHKGGGEFSDIALLEPGRIGVVHVNDFPLGTTREKLTDKDRRFPGEGDADLAQYGAMLLGTGYHGFISLELFIDDYGARSGKDVLRHGVRSMCRTFGA